MARSKKLTEALARQGLTEMGSWSVVIDGGTEKRPMTLTVETLDTYKGAEEYASAYSARTGVPTRLLPGPSTWSGDGSEGGSRYTRTEGSVVVTTRQTVTLDEEGD